MNDKTDSVAMPHILTETGKGPAFDGLGPIHSSDICTDRSRGLNQAYEAKAEGMGRMQTAYFVEADVDPAKLDFVTVNGMRFVPAADVDVLIERGRQDRESADKLERILERRLASERLKAAGMSLKLADMTTNRDALDEACQRKDARIEVLTGEIDRMNGMIAALERAHDAIRSNWGIGRAEVEQLTTQIADLTAERDNARNGWLVDLSERERLETALADMTAERDAAAENARRERDRRGTYSDETLRACAAVLYQSSCELGVGNLYQAGPNEARTREAFVERILRTADLVSEREEKPVVRVVTSPRFYGEEDRERARSAVSLVKRGPTDPFPFDYQGAFVDAVAQALGMRRA